LIKQITDRLRAEYPSAFAGVGFAPDGVLNVYSTGDEHLAELVAQLAPAAAPLVQLRLIAGMQNGFDELEQLQQQVIAGWLGVERHGVVVRSCGVDIVANRLRLGVAEVTPRATAVLEEAFGSGRVKVVQAQLFRP
jgi:hypothetical protein